MRLTPISEKKEPDQFIPTGLPECDLILAIGIHLDLLSALPDVVKKTKAKAVIAPAEDSKKTPAGKMFIGAGVIRDASFGSTWFVAKKLYCLQPMEIKSQALTSEN